MAKPEPFDQVDVAAMLTRISQRAARTVRDAGAKPAEGTAQGPEAPVPRRPDETALPRRARPLVAPSASPSVPPPADRPAEPAARPAVRYGRRRSDEPRSTAGRPTLNEEAIALLQVLPPPMRLVALRNGFARIVNHIAAIWDDAQAFDRYVDSLLVDTRGKRQGFPLPVVAELAELRAYHRGHVWPRSSRNR
jgi:hypothetical protein